MQLVAHAMMINLTCQRTQISGCKLLCVASIETATGTMFVEAVLFAMVHHYSSESIQVSGCKFLACCSYHFRYIEESSELEVMIVEAVLSAMEHFPQSTQVQETALAALESFLSHQKLMNTIQLRSSRVIRSVHEAMTLSSSIETFERGSDIISVCESS
jgi:hypothetical protein